MTLTSTTLWDDLILLRRHLDWMRKQVLASEAIDRKPAMLRPEYDALARSIRRLESERWQRDKRDPRRERG